jgi:hypothetical protein
VIPETPIVIVPDAGPLITLAYAEALDLLLKPGWPVWIVDMVLHEVTRNDTPTSMAIGAWVSRNKLHLLRTDIHQDYFASLANDRPKRKKSNLGERAIQEAVSKLVLSCPETVSVLLFEDHKISRAAFVLPETCRKVSTRAFLGFLEQKGWLESAVAVERKAILNGRNFSQIRFPA